MLYAKLAMNSLYDVIDRLNKTVVTDRRPHGDTKTDLRYLIIM